MCKASFRTGVQVGVQPRQDCSGWEMLMSLEELLTILDQMTELPSVEDFICIVQKCRKEKDLAYAKRVHVHICNNELELHRAIGNYTVPMFVECGSVSDAQQVFNRLVHPNEHSWTSMILGYIQCGQTRHALNLYQKMQDYNVHPSRYTLMALLKACARLKDVEKGREIHVDITRKGFEIDLFVGSNLVDMYAKCGSVAKAREVFDKLPARDVVSWASLIAGYAEHGPGQEALKCLIHMQLEGIFPDAVMFVCILKACSNIGAIGEGRQTHTEITHKGFERDPYVGNSLVDMYAKCGSLSEAQEVFEKLPVRDVISWTALIAGYAEHGCGQEALRCYEQMQLQGFPLNAVTFICILKACASMGAIGKGREIHAEITQKGFEQDHFVGNTLVDLYAKCGSLSEAWEVFDKLQVRDVVSWATLIAGYAEHGPGQEALECFQLMQLEGVSPDAVTYIYALKACGSIGSLGKGQALHIEFTQKGFEVDILVGSTLVDMYAKCGSLSEARKVFDQLPVRDVVLWDTLIAGYAEHGHVQDALTCFDQMQVEGIPPDVATFIYLLKACSSIGALEKGRKIHALVTQERLETEILVGSSLVDMYAKCGALSDAWEAFSKLPVRDVVSWTAIIAGFAEHGLGQEALHCVEQMQLEGVCPNIVTFACTLKACGSIGALGKGRELHCKIAQRGFEKDPFLSNALVDMYAKCGSLLEAGEVFDELPVQGTLSWSAMIKAYGMNNEGNIAVRFFEDMQEEGVKPDAVTFTCLLTACSHSNLLFKGQEYFKVMREEYGVAPTIDHYTCMVDLLARSGHLHEADRLLETMHCPLSEGMLTALLSACKTYGDAAVGLKCFQQLVRTNPGFAASYVLMENIYTSAGCRNDAC